MIRLLGWCVVVAALVAVGWYGRDALAALDRAPVTVTVSKPASPVRVARAAPKARPAQARPQEKADPPETNDAVGPWTPKGIGYYDVRQTSGRY